MPQHTRTKGQALVEFALASTLIFFMLAAVVDLGLIFFTLQGLHNAAQEGATYGSRWLLTNASGTTTLDAVAIRDRVRHEAGNQGIGFANLLDLNGNGQDDVVFNEQSNGKPLIQDYIQVVALADKDGNGDPLNDNTPCPNVSSSTAGCFIKVVVSADYNMAFPLAPAFGDKIKLNSTFVMPMRSGFSQGGAPTITPVVVTVTPTP